MSKNGIACSEIRYVRRPINKKYDIRHQINMVKHGDGIVMCEYFSPYEVRSLILIEFNMHRDILE